MLADLVYKARLSLLSLVANINDVLQDLVEFLGCDLVEQALDSLLLLDLLWVVSLNLASLHIMTLPINDMSTILHSPAYISFCNNNSLLQLNKVMPERAIAPACAVK